MAGPGVQVTQFPRAQCNGGKGGPADTVSGARSKPPAEYPTNLVDNTGMRQTSGAGPLRLDTATEGDNYQAVGEIHVSLERRGTLERAK
jgi:hypothetical protein